MCNIILVIIQGNLHPNLQSLALILLSMYQSKLLRDKLIVVKLSLGKVANAFNQTPVEFQMFFYCHLLTRTESNTYICIKYTH